MHVSLFIINQRLILSRQCLALISATMQPMHLFEFDVFRSNDLDLHGSSLLVT
jgi:hypothetical protein